MPNRPAAPGGLILYGAGSPLGVDRGVRASVRDAVRRFHEVRESAPTLERTSVREASVGGAKPTGAGRMLVRLIRAGVSLNGNAYPAHVLREAAKNRAWAKGCKAYIDHATPEEEEAHPSGSVKNLAAVLTEDARWDEGSQSLVAEVRLFEPWRSRLTEMAEADAVGMSIRAWVSGAHGEYEGREAFIVEKIEGGRSVDFVTVPAAGGGIISVLEAVGNTVPAEEAANLGAWLESRLHLALTTYADEMYGDGRLTREERITLSAAIGDGLQAWTARVEADAPQLFQRSRYEEPAEPVLAMTDETTEAAEPEFRQGTQVMATQMAPGYEPPSMSLNPPAPEPQDVTDGTPPPAPVTPNPQEEPVSGIQTGAPPEQAGTAVPDNVTPAPTTEAVAPAVVQPTAEAIAAIVAEAVRAATAPLTVQIGEMSARESARDAAIRDTAHRQTATEAVTTALQATEHADVTASIRARVTSRVTAAVPVTAEGVVDHAALGEFITTVIADEANHVRRERASALEAAGVGLPYGMGGTSTVESVEDDGLDGQLERFFNESLGLPESAAKIAARGRG
jgi:hypothetical protein